VNLGAKPSTSAADARPVLTAIDLQLQIQATPERHLDGVAHPVGGQHVQHRLLDVVGSHTTPQRVVRPNVCRHRGDTS
jgi:hypothetical protein